MIEWFRRLFGLRPRVEPFPPAPTMAGSRGGVVPLGPSYTILPPRQVDPFTHTLVNGTPAAGVGATVPHNFGPPVRAPRG